MVRIYIYIHIYRVYIIHTLDSSMPWEEYAKRLRENDFVLGRVEQPEPVEESAPKVEGGLKCRFHLDFIVISSIHST